MICRKEEMDKRGRCGFSNAKKRRHFNKHNKLFSVLTAAATCGGGTDRRFSEKSKKEKVRSLSAVSRALFHCEMGCRVSDEQQPSSAVISAGKRFNGPNNFLNDCNGSVPRKLRSATKKRSRESILLESEKVNHRINGIESTEKESVKRSKKQGIRPQWSPGEGVSGPITKDEEEVAEALYALAGMFPDNGEPLPENSSALQDLEDNANAAVEGSATAQGASPCPESSQADASKISSLNETVGQEQPDLPERETVMVKSVNSKKVALHDSELCLAMGLNMSIQSQISQTERKPDVELEAARQVDSKQKHVIKEQKEKGLALWPGLSPVASSSQAYLQSPSANKAPNWLETAISASKHDVMETCSSSGQIPKVVIHKRSWKRCATHVRISHVIRSLAMQRRQVVREQELHDQIRAHDQMRAHEGSKCGVLSEVHNLNGGRNGVNFATLRNPHESKNGILQQQRHYSDISQTIPAPGVYGPQKQSFNFLSLSTGSNGLKVENNNYDKIGSRMEQLSKLQVPKLQMPYFQSLAQQHGVMQIPMPQNQYASTSYFDQLSVAGPQVGLRQPHYYGSPLVGTHYSSTVSNKQDHQSFWEMQQASQGRSIVSCNIMRTQYPNWQSARHESPAVNPCAQATLPRSPASQEIFGSKIASISGQQQHLISSIQEKWARSSPSFCM